MKTIEQRVREVLAQQHNVTPEAVVLTMPLHAPAADSDGDSLDRVETVMALEDEFGILIPDWDADQLTSVQDAIDYCSKPQTQRATSLPQNFN